MSGSAATEWFTRLTLRLSDFGQLDRATHALQESFHPNSAGHAEFARCLTEFLAAGDGNVSAKLDDGERVLVTPTGLHERRQEWTKRLTDWSGQDLVPLAGAFCAGEIGPIGGRNFLHGFTASVAVFG